MLLIDECDNQEELDARAEFYLSRVGGSQASDGLLVQKMPSIDNTWGYTGGSCRCELTATQFAAIVLDRNKCCLGYTNPFRGVSECTDEEYRQLIQLLPDTSKYAHYVQWRFFVKDGQIATAPRCDDSGMHEWLSDHDWIVNDEPEMVLGSLLNKIKYVDTFKVILNTIPVNEAGVSTCVPIDAPRWQRHIVALLIDGYLHRTKYHKLALCTNEARNEIAIDINSSTELAITKIILSLRYRGHTGWDLIYKAAASVYDIDGIIDVLQSGQPYFSYVKKRDGITFEEYRRRELEKE